MGRQERRETLLRETTVSSPGEALGRFFLAGSSVTPTLKRDFSLIQAMELTGHYIQTPVLGDGALPSLAVGKWSLGDHHLSDTPNRAA